MTFESRPVWTAQQRGHPSVVALGEPCFTHRGSQLNQSRRARSRANSCGQPARWTNLPGVLDVPVEGTHDRALPMPIEPCRSAPMRSAHPLGSVVARMRFPRRSSGELLRPVGARSSLIRDHGPCPAASRPADYRSLDLGRHRVRLALVEADIDAWVDASAAADQIAGSSHCWIRTQPDGGAPTGSRRCRHRCRGLPLR